MEKIFIDPGNVNHSLVEKAAEILRQGKLVAFPTETVYGIGCRVDRKDAVKKLYAIKKRPIDKPFAIALHGIDGPIDNYFITLPSFGYRLIERFWPGPLTIVYYSQDDKKIGIRVPSHIIAREILKELVLAVYLPSANISGEKESASAAEVEAALGSSLDLIVDGGLCAYPQASTVIDLTYSPFKILREGAVGEREIISTFVKKRIMFVCAGNSCRSPMAQFLLEKYLSQERDDFEHRYEIISRGIYAFEGAKASEPVIDILKEKEELDLSLFNAKALDKYAVLSSDLIFTMEDAQSEYILKLVPTAEGRVFTLKKFLTPELEQNIPDPIGKEPAFYEKVYSLIKEAILELRDWV